MGWTISSYNHNTYNKTLKKFYLFRRIIFRIIFQIFERDTKSPRCLVNDRAQIRYSRDFIPKK